MIRKILLVIGIVSFFILAITASNENCVTYLSLTVGIMAFMLAGIAEFIQYKKGTLTHPIFLETDNDFED